MKIQSLVVLGVIVLTYACTPFTMARQTPTTTPSNAIAASDLGFAASLYHHLEAGGKNLWFSPYSVRAALAMTYVGAGGTTATQMAKALDFPAGSAQTVARSFADLNAQLNDSQSKVTLSIANAVWGEQGLPFAPSFMDVLSSGFSAPLRQADFRTGSGPARSAINDWVARHTAGKITNLFPAGSINPSTALVLANAVYFKGQWEHPFKTSATDDAPFHLDPSHTASVPMMNGYFGRMNYAQLDGMQAVELPYEGDQLSMVLLVPSAIEGLPGIEQKLDADHLRQWMGAMRPRAVDLKMPKLNLNQKFNLTGTLAAMGMTDAFSRNANFSLMLKSGSSHEPLFISEVFHQATATVDEQGTVAAAATGIGMTSMAMVAHPAPVVHVSADRPFIVLIRHRPSGAILFLGRVSDLR